MGAKERILVVEDDPIVAALFEELLPEHGIDTVVVDDAEAGLARLADESFDLILADKNLPGMSGIDLLARVKATRPAVDVIIMTAYADMASLLQAVDRGVYDYLIKPFDSIDEVVQKIQRALEKRRIKLENLRLIEDLTKANTRIEQMNHDLEQQVNERTRELRDANERLEELSLTDDVTGLSNQRCLYQRLEEEFRRERRYRAGLAVIMLDLDEFKRVNDSHDHLFGSRVLARVGRLLQQTVRSIDSTVRYGGDEFVVVLPHTTLASAAKVAERIRACLQATDVGDGGPVSAGDVGGIDLYTDPYTIEGSLGVASLSECAADSPRSLLRAADRALYAAKAGGRNRVCVMRGDVVVAQAG